MPEKHSQFFIASLPEPGSLKTSPGRGSVLSVRIHKANVRRAGAGRHQFSTGDRYPRGRGRAGCGGAAAEPYSPGGLQCWAEGGTGHPCLTRKDDPVVKAK